METVDPFPQFGDLTRWWSGNCGQCASVEHSPARDEWTSDCPMWQAIDNPHHFDPALARRMGWDGETCGPCPEREAEAT
jgi:hypothetical protein